MKNILILGASSDIGLSLLNVFKNNPNYKIGAHCNKGSQRLKNFTKKNLASIKIFSKDLKNRKNCEDLVNKYLNWSKSIDILIQLNGSISSNKNWELVNEKNWNDDLAINLSAPFFISQIVFKKMQKKGGKIIFTSTSSANKGGSQNSIGYGVAKSGLISLTKTLAKDGGKFKILVNCIAPGFILTRLHSKKLNKNKSEINKRKKLNVLNQTGNPKDVSNLIEFLISDKNKFITGEVIRIDGGDWL
jgi:3-oxoacyl-[acyl-carrier protein] reductase